MALQDDGIIKVSELRGEFGGSSPDLMSEYYRGAGLVPNSQTSIPTSGEILLSDFYSTSDETIITVTQGLYDSGGQFATRYWGFSEDVFQTFDIGSVNPTTFSGSTINQLMYYEVVSFSSLYFILSGNHSKSLFETLQPQGATAFASADSLHDYDGTYNQTTWSWGSVVRPSVWDGSGNVTVTIV